MWNMDLCGTILSLGYIGSSWGLSSHKAVEAQTSEPRSCVKATHEHFHEARLAN